MKPPDARQNSGADVAPATQCKALDLAEIIVDENRYFEFTSLVKG